MGLRPDTLCADRGRMSGRGPDVRAFPRRRMSGPRGRMSGLEGLSHGCLLDSGAGFPARARMSGAPDVRGSAGCPAAVAPRRLHLRHFLIRVGVDLSYASSISLVVSSVPKHM